MQEESIFLDAIGDSPTMRILQYLIEGRELDYSLTDTATKSGVSWGTLHKIFPKLLQYKLVIPTREIGRAKLFKINLKNLVIKKLVEIYDSLLIQETEKHLTNKKIELKI